MAEATISGPVENAAKLTNAEIEATKRGLSFAIRLTSAMALAAVLFFVLWLVGYAIGRGEGAGRHHFYNW